MHIFFSGIGGTGIGPLALIAKQAGYQVSGSDKQHSAYIDYLEKQGVKNVHVGQTLEAIELVHRQKPIDWFVYSSALPKENPNHPELVFCRENNIKTSKRDELLNEILSQKHLKLLAVAGTHGKTTTTAMLIWLLQQAGVPVSYSVGAKTNFSEMGQYQSASEYFVYECDEYDHNFLAFHPYLSIITGIAYDHADVYPTLEGYQQAFRDFINQSGWKIIWQSDADKLSLNPDDSFLILDDGTSELSQFSLSGIVNRQNAWQVVQAVHKLTNKPVNELVADMNRFPGVSRRFEQIKPNIYSDYAHTPEKIRGAIGTALETNPNVIVVYEGLHNRRQHFIKDRFKDLFDGVKKLYWVPSYLAREDPNLPLLSPQELIEFLGNQEIAEPAELNDALKQTIQRHADAGDLVLCLSAGGGDSLDEWLRKNFPS